jgi:hypothetical protein
MCRSQKASPGGGSGGSFGKQRDMRRRKKLQTLYFLLLPHRTTSYFLLKNLLPIAYCKNAYCLFRLPNYLTLIPKL